MTDLSINHHYGGISADAIFASLQTAGKDIAQLSPVDFAFVDQFHTRGWDATLELAQRAGLKAGMHILDAGGGIGGAARTLASELGCHVTVLDLTETYCQVGEVLTEVTHLSHLVTFKHGSALDIPFPDQHFDVAWTQHSSMNIADKQRLYRELHRVLKPAGALAIHEIMAGPNAPIHFPVPWARTPDMSHLRLPEDARRLIRFIGFEEVLWTDESARAVEWFRARVAATTSTPAPPPSGLHLLLGLESGVMIRNLLRNLEEQRLTVVQGMFKC